MGKVQDIQGVGDLEPFVNKKIALVGRVSDVMWQHVMNPPASHPHETYFDTGGTQIVLYSQEPIHETDRIRVEGTVIAVEGGGEGTKSPEKFTEYHLIVDTWEKDK